MSKPKKRLDSLGGVIRFDYETSGDHKLLRIDGVWGGVTAKGDIQMSVFVEGMPIPEFENYRLNDEKTSLVPVPPSQKGQKKIIRETQASLLLNLEVARALQIWLNDKISQLEKVMLEAKMERTISQDVQESILDDKVKEIE